MTDRDHPPERGIGARLRAARKRLGWTREELAVHCGMSYSGIAQIESGRRRNLRPDTLTALADGLGVSIDYLVDGGARASTMLEHRALIYRDQEEFVMTAAPFLREGLDRSEALLAVTTPANIAALRKELGRDARAITFVESEGWYRTPSATLKSFQSFREDALEDGRAWVRVIGEPVWIGRSDAETRVWTRLESLLNLLFASAPLTILCPYNASSTSRDVLSQAEATHPAIVSREGIFDSEVYRDPREFVFDV